MKLNSGLVALTFTSLIYFNMLGLKIWFKKPISKNIIIGGMCGAIGIVFLFWKEISSIQQSVGPIIGISIGILATFFASIGNMFAFKNHQLKVPVVVFNSYGMLYGAICSLVIGLINHEYFNFPTSPSFLFSLLYLVIFGTVIAFWAYQTIVGTMGADRAAYSSIISPMIAVIVSTLFEGIHFTPFLFIGIILCLVGNFIALNINFNMNTKKTESKSCEN